MVRTGARARALQSLLTRAGLRTDRASPRAPRLETLSPVARERAVTLFNMLVGRMPMPPLRPGSWDLAFASGLVVELDEELHFNRYRAQTLHAEWATSLPWQVDYLQACTDREQDCLAAGTWGKRWTTPSSESMFGPPGDPRDLDGLGSPRWRQRALYDAIKDIATLDPNTPRLCRVSVWDRIGETTLAQVLAGAESDNRQLRDLIDSRTV